MTAAPTQRTAPHPAALAARPCAGRALVLDDDPVMRVALQNVLSMLGWQVEALGEEVAAALDAVAGGASYDLVVLDRALGDGLADDLARMLPLLQPAAHVVMLTSAALCRVPDGVDRLLPRAEGLGPLLDHLAGRGVG